MGVLESSNSVVCSSHFENAHTLVPLGGGKGAAAKQELFNSKNIIEAKHYSILYYPFFAIKNSTFHTWLSRKVVPVFVMCHLHSTKK